MTQAQPAGPGFDAAGAAAPEQSRSQRVFLALSRSWLFVFLLLLLAFFWLSTPSGTFFSRANLTQISLSTSEVVLLAIGQTFVIVTAGIDLSVGGILFFAGVCGGEVMLYLSGTHDEVIVNGLYPHAGIAVFLGVLVCIGAGTVCGFANGAAITKLKLPPFIVTLGMLGITFGLGEVIDGGSYLPAPVPPTLSQHFGSGKFLGLYYPIWVALGFLIVAHVVFQYTRFGRYTRAVGSNDEATRRTGIAVDWHIIKVYTLAGFLAGVAAIVDLAIYTNTTAVSHRTDNLTAISAVVLGGTSLFGGIGSILMTAVGAFVPTVLQNGLVIKDVQPFWQEVVVGATIIFAVYLDQVRRRRTNSA
ncbi:MAG TPA: ABC transporter permease [Gaiellaceae bacterium]|nr:ABC transporter permease [Gaiellaceae bacterium]